MALGFLLAPLAITRAAENAHVATCTLQPGPVRAVVRVIDAETVLLDDDREVRLIGALAPRSPDLRANAAPWPPEERALAELRDLVLGRSVELAFSGRHVDRYGRLLAHLFLNRDGERIWVQGRLLSSGNARAYGLPGNTACLHEMLAHERVAREARVGIWSDAVYAPRSASAPGALLRQRNSFQIVTGRIAHVAPTKSRTYLNFGSDWHSDFTAGISAGVLRAHPEWAQTLAGLEGRRVEVRGWIEYRNGPYIAVEDVNQIEPVDETPRPAHTPGGPSMSSDRRVAPPAAKEKRPGQTSPGAINL